MVLLYVNRNMFSVVLIFIPFISEFVHIRFKGCLHFFSSASYFIIAIVFGRMFCFLFHFLETLNMHAFWL